MHFTVNKIIDFYYRVVIWFRFFFFFINSFITFFSKFNLFVISFFFRRVQNLKETIERLHGIPATKQVLMISGGEVLNSSSRVCSYSSGTDENPIYMFSILFDNSKLLQPWPSEIRKYFLTRTLSVISINCIPLCHIFYFFFLVVSLSIVD